MSVKTIMKTICKLHELHVHDIFCTNCNLRINCQFNYETNNFFKSIEEMFNTSLAFNYMQKL